MENITYTIIWDDTEFKVPGKIQQIASSHIDQGLTDFIGSVAKCKRLYVKIVICGHDDSGRINVSRYKKNNFLVAINAKRLFCDDLQSEGERLGRFVRDRAISGIINILDNYHY